MINSNALSYISKELIGLGFYADKDIRSSTVEIRVGSGIKKGLPDRDDASSIDVILKVYNVYIADQKVIVGVPTVGGKGKEWKFDDPKEAVELLEDLLA